jgi:hypothetical protein
VFLASLTPCIASGAAASEAANPSWIARGALALALGSAVIAFSSRRRAAARARVDTLFAPVPNAFVSRRHPPTEIPATVSLRDRIQNAATVSVEFGRILGIIYFRLPARGGPNGATAMKWTQGDLAELFSRFGGALTNADHIAVINEVEIVVCVGLLHGYTELAAKAERLRIIGADSRVFASAFARPGALALYPMCGYQADELIAFARSRHRRDRVAPALTCIESGADGRRSRSSRRSRPDPLLRLVRGVEEVGRARTD